jgi:uncharacterized protein (DUF433 family)
MPLVVAADPLPLRLDADGVARIGKTRVTLDTVVYAFRDGLTAEEIVQQYPSVDLSDIYAVLGYCLKRQSDVDAYLREREKESAAVRQDNEIRFDPVGIRDRLKARRSAQG